MQNSSLTPSDVWNIDCENQLRLFNNNVQFSSDGSTTITPIVRGTEQTKEWRNKQKTYTNGKRSECEKIQISQLRRFLGHEIEKTSLRFDTDTNKLYKNCTKLTNFDIISFSENFDGKFLLTSPTGVKIHCLLNLKMICGSGGAQMRSYREVRKFVKSQLEYLLDRHTEENVDVCFINILDGDFCGKYNGSIMELVRNAKYNSIAQFVFVGDMYEFFHFYHTTLLRRVYFSVSVSNMFPSLFDSIQIYDRKSSPKSSETRAPTFPSSPMRS